MLQLLRKNSVMKFVTHYFEYRKMKSLIMQATKTIYAEKFDFENILRRLSSQTNTLHALIAIKYAVYTNEPIDKEDIEQALDEFLSCEKDIEKGREMEIFINLLKESTEVDWLERLKQFLKANLPTKKKIFI
jgi:hypothetical protein